MSDLSKKHISVKAYDSVKAYQGQSSERVSGEVVEIKNFTPEEAWTLEEQGFFYMPSTVTYIRKTVGTWKEVLASLSKDKRRNVKRVMSEYPDLEIVKESPVSASHYNEWYQGIYVPTIKAKKHGILSAPEAWAEQHSKHKKAGLFIKINGKVVAGMVAKCRDQDILPRRVSISFSATKEEWKVRGVGDFLHACMILFAHELGYEHISHGRDVNMYGKHLSAGLPLYKMSFGYELIALKKHPVMLVRLNDLSKFDDVIFFVSYAKNSQRLTGNVIVKREGMNVDAYDKPFFGMLRVFLWDHGNLRLLEERKK